MRDLKLKIVGTFFTFLTVTALYGQQPVITHVVQRGETFASIAAYYNITEHDLRIANPNAKTCFTGMKLTIKKSATNAISQQKNQASKISSEQSNTSANNIEKTIKNEDNGFQWYELCDGILRGAEDKSGHTLIPLSRGYTGLFYRKENGMFHVLIDNNWGVCDVTGKEIISPKRGYSNVVFLKGEGLLGFYSVEKNEAEGICDINGKEIISPNRGYSSITYLNDGDHDGYYSVEKNKSKGICDINGKEIISPNRGYSDILFLKDEGKDGYYSVKKNKSEGVCDINGKEIISPNRGYSNITFIKEKGHVGYYSVEKNGLEGVCEINGKEIVACKYNDIIYGDDSFEYQNSAGEFIALNIKLDKQGNAFIDNGNPSSTPSAKELFDLAYNTPDSETQLKFDRYQKVLQADPNNKYGYKVLAYNNIGCIYDNLGDKKNAKAYFEAALKLNPNDETTKKNLKNTKRDIRNERWNTIANVLGAISEGLAKIESNQTDQITNYPSGSITDQTSLAYQSMDIGSIDTSGNDYDDKNDPKTKRENDKKNRERKAETDKKIKQSRYASISERPLSRSYENYVDLINKIKSQTTYRGFSFDEKKREVKNCQDHMIEIRERFERNSGKKLPGANEQLERWNPSRSDLMERCSACYGDGKCNNCYRKGNGRCSSCGGTGNISRTKERLSCPNCRFPGNGDCKTCDGSGKCQHCNGKGEF